MKLEALFHSNRAEIEEGLKEAEQELRDLERRCAELRSLIERGKAALGVSVSESDLTLHQALVAVLMDHQNEWMSVKDLTAEVSARGLYRMRDGRPPQTSQVHARVRNYPDLFEKDGSMVRSRYTVSTADLPKTGAYDAVETRVRATDGAEMLVVSRVAYSVIPPGGEDGAQYARRMSEDRAWRIVAGGGFEAGSIDTALLTTHGWEPVAGER